jgi:hypothetical protein
LLAAIGLLSAFLLRGQNERAFGAAGLKQHAKHDGGDQDTHQQILACGNARKTGARGRIQPQAMAGA